MKNIDNKLVTKICYLHYIENQNQNQIAKHYGLTRQAVSRIIQESLEDGLVKIQINSPIENVVRLESKLESRFNLKEVIVVKCNNDSTDYLVYQAGQVLAIYFSKIIMQGMNVGVGTGQYIESMSKYIASNPADKNRSNVNIVQLIGGDYNGDSSSSSELIISRISDKMGFKPLFLNLPLIIEDNNTKDLSMKLPIIKHVFDIYNNLDIAIVEVKPVHKPYIPFGSESGTKSMKFLNTLGINYLDNTDYAGEICVNYYNDRGMFIDSDISNQVVAISNKQLKRVKNMVTVAIGENLAKASIGVLKSGLVDTFITDEYTANEILKYIGGDYD